MKIKKGIRRLLETATRPLSSAKVVNSILLNRLGLQVARTLAAHFVHDLRPATKVEPETRLLLSRLDDDGLVVIPNFLEEKEFEALKNECLSYLEADQSPLLHLGPTTIHHASVSENRARDYPRLKQFFSNPLVVHLLEAGEKIKIDERSGYRLVERVVHGDGAGIDQESRLHSDTFHPTHKLWLYLSDVSEEDGPLVYCKGTHRLAKSQIKYIYRHSCQQDVNPSRRITKDEIEERGLKETRLACSRNTVVVADTHGYHRRGEGLPGHERLALQFMLRTDPFVRRRSAWG